MIGVCNGVASARSCISLCDTIVAAIPSLSPMAAPAAPAGPFAPFAPKAEPVAEEEAPMAARRF